MLLRPHEPVVLPLYVWGILLASLAWLGYPESARADDFAIHFGELESHISTRSPRAHILAQELEKLRAGRDDALQWSNPEIAYDHEDAGSDREWQLTLHKSFTMPLSHGKRRAGWAGRILSAELQVEQEQANLLADLKSGYVRLRLLNAFLSRLAQLEYIIKNAAATTENRYNEGELSGIERDLLQLLGFSLSSNRLKAAQERGDVESSWRAEMGIQEGDHADLVTTIGYEAVDLPASAELVRLLDERPGVRSRAILRDALLKQADAAKPSLLPGIDLFAGYKRIEPESDGWVAGAMLSLPVFDRKGGASREREAEALIAGSELLFYRNHAAREIDALVQLVKEAEQTLGTIADHMETKPPVMANLLYSYQEGQITLDTFLNAIQIEVTGYTDYYDLLSTYYSNIFRLEAITGSEIVSFAP